MPPNTYPVRTFPDLVRPLRLPTCNSLKTAHTGSPEDVLLNIAFFIVRKILSWMAQVLNIHL